MSILGLHHITLVSSNAQRTLDFYTRVLGIRLVKQTVNFDDPEAYHLYFGDRTGRPGTAVTYFEWRNMPKGHPGIGGTHHVALQVKDYGGLLMWKRRLIDLGIPVTGPYDRVYFTSIYFHDPDGVIMEIATLGPGWTVDESPESLGSQLKLPPASLTVRNRDEARIQAEIHPQPVPVISAEMSLSRGMHHITAISSNIDKTHALFGELLGMRLVKRTTNFDDPTSPHWYWAVGEGAPGTILTYFQRDPNHEPRAHVGVGRDSPLCPGGQR